MCWGFIKNYKLYRLARRALRMRRFRRLKYMEAERIGALVAMTRLKRNRNELFDVSYNYTRFFFYLRFLERFGWRLTCWHVLWFHSKLYTVARKALCARSRYTKVEGKIRPIPLSITQQMWNNDDLRKKPMNSFTHCATFDFFFSRAHITCLWWAKAAVYLSLVAAFVDEYVNAVCGQCFVIIAISLVLSIEYFSAST